MTSPAPAVAARTTRNTTLAIVLTLAAMVMLAVMDGLAKILSHTLPIPEIMWVRNIAFCALALSLLKMQGLSIRTHIRSGQPWLQLSRGVLLMVESGLFMMAFRLMPIADVHAIAASAPLMVVALSVPMLGEKVGWRRWAAVLAGFIGVVLIVRPAFATVQPPVMIALAAAALWALYQIMVRLCARTDRSETTSLWTAIIGFLATSLIAPSMWIWPGPGEWILLVIISALGSLAHSALIKAYALIEPSLLQPYSYTLFVWAVVVGFVLFGDTPNLWTWAGATIIVLSGLFVWWRERTLRQKA